MVSKNYIFILLLIQLGLVSGQDAFDGYTLFTPQTTGNSGAITYLIDNDHNIIQSWNHPNGPASMPYLIIGDEPGLENISLSCR